MTEEYEHVTVNGAPVSVIHESKLQSFVCSRMSEYWKENMTGLAQYVQYVREHPETRCKEKEGYFYSSKVTQLCEILNKDKFIPTGNVVIQSDAAILSDSYDDKKILSRQDAIKFIDTYGRRESRCAYGLTEPQKKDILDFARGNNLEYEGVKIIQVLKSLDMLMQSHINTEMNDLIQMLNQPPEKERKEILKEKGLLTLQEVREYISPEAARMLTRYPVDKVVSIIEHYPGIEQKSKGKSVYSVVDVDKALKSIVNFEVRNNRLPSMVEVDAASSNINRDAHSEPQKAAEGEDRSKSIPDSQIIHKPINTDAEQPPVEEMTSDDESILSSVDGAEPVDVMKDFEGYPEELKSGKGWMINCNKRPIHHKLLQQHIADGRKPSYQELASGKNVYLRMEWEKGEECLSLMEAREILHQFQDAYSGQPETVKLFGLCELCSKWPELIFFEWDNCEVQHAYGQKQFFEYCCKMGYHVSKSFSGNAHYVMKIPEQFKKYGVFKWHESDKGSKEEDKDFEIEHEQGQWNETGELHSYGCIIPSNDNVALKFIQDRINRRIKRKGNPLQDAPVSSVGTQPTEDNAAASSPDQTGVSPCSQSNIDVPHDLIVGARDDGKVKQFINNPPVTCKIQVCSLKEDKGNLSELMHGLFKDCIKAGCNLNTTIAIFYKTTLNDVYKSRGQVEYEKKINKHKFEQSYQSAYAEVQREKMLPSGNIAKHVTQPTVEEFTEEELQEAREIYESGKALEYIVQSCQENHIGDNIVQAAAILSYASTRVRSGNGIHLTVKGSAASGKTHCLDMVKLRLPEWAIIPQGSVSDKAYFYMAKGNNAILRKGCILHMDDQTLTPVQEEIMKARTSDFWKPFHHYTVSGDRKDYEDLIIPEACPQWLTAVTDNSDEQTQSRVLVLRINETKEQREKVDTIKGEMALHPKKKVEDSHTTRVCRAMWELMSMEDYVSIPFYNRIKNNGDDDAANRTKDIFLTLIQSVAYLRTPVRERDAEGCIIATEQDYQTAVIIMNESIETKNLDLSDKQKRLLKYLTEDTEREIFNILNQSSEGENKPDITNMDLGIIGYSERAIHPLFSSEINVPMSFVTFENIVHGRKRKNGTQDTGLDSVTGIRFYQKRVSGRDYNMIEVNYSLYERGKAGSNLFYLAPTTTTDDKQDAHSGQQRIT